VLVPPPSNVCFATGHFGAGAAVLRASRSAAADGLVERQLRVGIGQLNGGSTTAAEVVAEVVNHLGIQEKNGNIRGIQGYTMGDYIHTYIYV
jgi:hypothetical protein